MHADDQRDIFKGKTLLYAEQTMMKWVMSRGAIPLLVPPASGEVMLSELLAIVDGIILQGGSDLSPLSYREEPISPRWPGDRIRDLYECSLVEHCLELNIPILGVCRGAQLLNVFFGGTLYQDIGTQLPDAMVHRDGAIYDKNNHGIEFFANGLLAEIYPGIHRTNVNSIHHQALKDLGAGLMVEARSEKDELIEAISYQKDGRFALGVQWHPEFIYRGYSEGLLDSGPLLERFFLEIEQRKKGKSHANNS
jgi:putative glutamine amidotransferase